jgi:integrase
VQDLLTESNLRMGPNGISRSTYCFRHTYATFRLSEGVDVYILAEQMGTSVKMIEQHYGHVNTVKHADRVLMGMTGWELAREPGDDSEAAARAAKAASTRDRAGRSQIRSSRRS